MKHAMPVSKVPAKALCGILFGDHPGLLDSIKGFIEDPLGTINLHFNKDNDPM